MFWTQPLDPPASASPTTNKHINTRGFDRSKKHIHHLNHIFIFKLTMIFLQSVASNWLVKRVQIKYLSMKYMIPAPLSRTTCKLGSSLLPWQGKLRDFRRVTWRRFFVRLFYAPLGYTSQNSQTNKDKIRETLCRIPRYTLRSRIKPGQRVFSLAFWVLVI